MKMTYWDWWIISITQLMILVFLGGAFAVALQLGGQKVPEMPS